MKKVIKIIVLCVLVGISFSSCGVLGDSACPAYTQIAE